jgi:opacity protein-like surface antigen
LVVERMSFFSGRLILVVALAALGWGGQTAHAQTGPVTYWTPLFGFGGALSEGQNATTYGNFPGFDFRDAGSGFAVARYNFSNGWFVGSERGLGWSTTGFNQPGAFGNSLYAEGVQFGYNLKSGGLPVTVYAGFDTLKYNTGMGGNPFAPLDSMSGASGYSARAGLEIQPTSNVSLSLGFGYTQRSGQQSGQSSGRVSDDAFNSAYMPLGGGR